jgi:hydroxymethylpyrimidine pyrophosphatase-like HAD family hydrolase
LFFVALATDYDGTLARHGHVDQATIKALQEVRRSGRKLLLVTGRDLPELRSVFPELHLFHLVVAENGALLFDPAKNEERPLADPPPQALVDRLRELGVAPLSVGRTIIATWEPHEKVVLDAIHDLALEHHIIFNKGAVMVLPGNVNKAWGLKRALKVLGLSPHNVVGIGDAENDQAFLAACGCAVAVANALPTVKAKADLVVADHGAGVIELARMLADRDMRNADLSIPRCQPVIGMRADGSAIRLSPFESMLIAGASGSGKSTVVTALIEEIQDLGFQVCIVDPEGDYTEVPDTVVVGDASQEPRLSEVVRLLAKPDVSVVVNLLAIDPEDRPPFLAKFLPEVAKLRAATGRPHWLVLDEAHHCLPAEWDPAPITLPRELPATVAVTVHPEAVATEFLKTVTMSLGVGSSALGAIEQFGRGTGRAVPDAAPKLKCGQVYLMGRKGTIEAITPRLPKEKQKRHARKYAEGDLGVDRSFWFRGPDNALKLRAQNLAIFLRMAEGVDDKTWLHHLRAGDYSRWFREAIKDDALAAETAAVEEDRSLSAEESLTRIRCSIETRYTAPTRK